MMGADFMFHPPDGGDAQKVRDLERKVLELSRALVGLLDAFWEPLFEGYEIDGGDVQDTCEHLGLIEELPVRPGDEELAADWDTDTLMYPAKLVEEARALVRDSR